jgi:hypothetical protein
MGSNGSTDLNEVESYDVAFPSRLDPACRGDGRGFGRLFHPDAADRMGARAHGPLVSRTFCRVFRGCIDCLVRLAAAPLGRSRFHDRGVRLGRTTILDANTLSSASLSDRRRGRSDSRCGARQGDHGDADSALLGLWTAKAVTLNPLHS